MERRKFLVGMGSLAAGAAAATGTGAMTNVRANRGVTVRTSNDADAYLGLEGDNRYVTDDSGNGELTINLGGEDNLGGGSTGSGNPGTQGDGFNDSAVTTVENVITVTNQGNKNGILIDFSGEGSYDRTTSVSIPNAEVTFELPEGGARRLNPGQQVKIDATVDTTDNAGSNGYEDLTIYGYQD